MKNSIGPKEALTGSNVFSGMLEPLKRLSDFIGQRFPLTLHRQVQHAVGEVGGERRRVGDGNLLARHIDVIFSFLFLSSRSVDARTS